MKLTTYKASSMQQALAKVKRDLGPGAMIVNTRSYRTGGFLGIGRKQVIEVTAGRRPPGQRTRKRGPAPPEAPAPPPRRKDPRVEKTYGQLVAEAREKAVDVSADELRGELNGLKDLVNGLIRETRSQRTPEVPAELLDTYVSLVSNEVADELAKDLVKRICAELPESQWRSPRRVREVLVRYVASRIDVAGPTGIEGRTPRVIAMIGPTGVGKTTTIAKLAAQFKLKQGRSVGLITIDTYRIAAVDQLRTYADIIDVPLRVVLTPRELKTALAEFKDLDAVLIDTAGRSQRDVLKMNELRQFLEAADPDETHLVLSSTAGGRNAQAVLEQFDSFDVDRVLLTKLDEAVGFGIVLSVLQQTSRKLSYVTTGQDVPEDIEIGDPRKLAELIVPAISDISERKVQA